VELAVFTELAFYVISCQFLELMDGVGLKTIIIPITSLKVSSYQTLVTIRSILGIFHLVVKTVGLEFTALPGLRSDFRST
jgi:hypothetical protein